MVSGRGSSSPEYDEIAKAAIFDSLRQIERFTKRPAKDVEAKNILLISTGSLRNFSKRTNNRPVAQLVRARLDMAEVDGSSPFGSTNFSIFKILNIMIL